LSQLAQFVESHPGLLPANASSPEFLARLREDVPRIAHHGHAIARLLAADSDYVALCHWNANVDNAWFWRDADGVLRCGLMDWGCVSQMNVGMAIWGAMSGAETDLWDRHFDELLQSFAAEVQRFGGPSLDPDRLRRHTLLYAAVMGIAWLLDVPALIRRRFGAAAPDNRKDPRIKDDESVRAPMQMLSNLLNLWDRTAWATCSTRPSTKRSASPKFAWRAHSISVIPCVTVASVVTNSGFLSVGVRRV